MKDTLAKNAVLPERPRLVLRVGFAGRQNLTASEESLLDEALDKVLSTLGWRLAALAPGTPVEAGKEPPVTAFYSRQCPLLRVVTGLCQGGDSRAAAAISRVIVAPDADSSCEVGTPCLETELGAVLPFDVETYRSSRPEPFRASFDQQLAQCAWVVALDGIYDKPEEDTTLSANRRARAYRAQSSVLLRQSDLLLVAANPDDQGRAGGTLETVKEALAYDLPVIFVHTGKTSADEAIYLIEPEELPANVLAHPALSVNERNRRLHDWITQITADPDDGLAAGSHHAEEAQKHGESVLTEYFDRSDSPGSTTKRWLNRMRKATWKKFESFFKGDAKGTSDPALAPYTAFRKRATELNYHYTGLYRGAFLLNYVLAIIAVILAAVSLTLMGTACHTPLGRDVAAIFEAGGKPIDKVAVSPKPPAWLFPVLIVLGAGKLGILILIGRNTSSANHNRWNDRAIDTRYLAERLRGMYYMPEVGIQQPPAAAPPQFASRAVRQSAVDWLFDAIVRSISPADLSAAAAHSIPSHDGRGTVAIRRLLTPQPVASLEKVRDAWIAGQAQYHENNTRTMHAMHHGLELLQKRLGWAVILIVGLDLILLSIKVFDYPGVLVPFAKAVTPWLIAASAVIPAIVAAVSGIRFQSECQALAERSDVMRSILAGRRGMHEPPRGRLAQAAALVEGIRSAKDHPATDLGSWTHDAMRFTERVATDFVQEAAEWSVLYAKEVSEPG